LDSKNGIGNLENIIKNEIMKISIKYLNFSLKEKCKINLINLSLMNVSYLIYNIFKCDILQFIIGFKEI